MAVEPGRDGNPRNIVLWLDYLINRDPLVNAQVRIGVVHHEIHEGEHYFYTVKDTSIGSAQPKLVLLKTPDSDVLAHFDFHVSIALAGTVELWEGVDPTEEGTERFFLNSYRDNGGTTTVQLFENPTIAAGSYGALLVGASVGAQGKFDAIGGGADSRHEILLKADTYYAISVQAVDDDCLCYITPDLYET